MLLCRKKIWNLIGEEVKMEIGPDDEMPTPNEAAKLLQMIEGEDVEKYLSDKKNSRRIPRA
jgi:hypothetical protein